MDLKKIKPGAIVVSVFLGLTVFYVNSKGTNVEQHNDIVGKFHLMKHVSALINQDLMSLRLVMSPSYDNLTNHMATYKTALGELGSGPTAIYGQGDSETDHLYAEYTQMIGKREQMIELFKSQTAQLNNSLQYLPSAIEQLKRKTGDRALLKNLDAVLRDLLIYNVASSDKLKESIENKLAALGAAPSMKTQDAVALMHHPRIILEKKELVDLQLKTLIELPINDLNEQLFDVYTLSYSRILHRSNQFRYLLYLACLVLLVYALNMFMRLRRTALALHIANITLEQRVSERTADLEKALENLTKTQSQLLQSEKMSAVGQLAAGVAHEINNPLGVILGFAQAVVRKIQPGEPLEAPLKSIEREALRCKSLVQDLLTFSRNGKAERVPLDVNQAVEGAASLIKTQAKTKNVSVIEKLSAQLPHVLADKNKLQQVLINLSNNALDAMPQGGQLTICTELLNETPQSWVVIKVTDNGAGIAPDILPRIFEPFFTTKPVGKGTGLGLSLVYEIVKSHSGTIDVSSRVGYTEFIIKLPVRTGHEMEAKMALERDAPEINKPPSRTQAA